MLRRIVRLSAVAAVAVLVAVPVSAQGQAPPKKAAAANTGAAAVKKFAPPRTPWGDPDLQGNFNTKNETGTPLERPDEFAGKRIEDITPDQLAELNKQRQRRSLENNPFAGGGSRSRGIALGVPIHWLDNLDPNGSRPWFVIDPPDGKVPPQTDEALRRAATAAKAREGRGTADSYTDRSGWDRCIARGPGVSEMQPKLYGNSFQILQTKDYVAIRYEMVHETQIIPIEGRAFARPHRSANLRTYFGDATARFEGDTLIVDTRNFNDRVNYRGAGPNLHVVERFRRTAAHTIEWTSTLEDSTTWARPWTFSMPLTEDDGQPIFEYACHEGNYGLRNILSAGRSDDRKGIKSSNSADAQADLKSEGEE